MPVHIYIRNGTPAGNVDLCTNCTHARIRRHADGEIDRQCSISDEQSRWAHMNKSPVVECSEWSQHTDKSLSAMASLAWAYIKDADGNITFRDRNQEPPELGPYMKVSPPSLWCRIRTAIVHVIAPQR